MTSYLQETKPAKVERLYDVLAATTAEIARLNALQVVGINQAVWTSQESQLVILRERQIVLTRELAAARAIVAPVAWYDFSAAASLWQDTARTVPITADGQMIKGVTDKSGNGNHLSEATNGPLYKVSITNGLSAGLYNGTTSLLTSVAALNLNVWTVFVVFNTTDVTANEKIVLGDSTNDTQSMRLAMTTAAVELYAGSLVTGSAITTSAWHIGLVEMNNTASNVWVDGGTKVLNAVNPGTTDLGNPRLGANSGGRFQKGYIAEVQYYNSVLNTADKNTLGVYLATRWGPTWNTVS